MAGDIFKTYFKTNFLMKYPIDYKSALVKVMASCWTDEKPLPRPVMNQFRDVWSGSNQWNEPYSQNLVDKQ